jgi:hypothetical protein
MNPYSQNQLRNSPKIPLTLTNFAMTPSSYISVRQSDDLEDPPVIDEVVKSMEVVHQENNQEEDDWNRAKCAGVVGGVAGCLTGGCWLSLVCATGCIYVAKREGTTGDIARAFGACGIKANVMAREVDEQHQVVDKSKKAAVAVWSKARDLNREHQIVEKTKDCVKSGVKAGVEFSREHKLVERTVKGVGKVFSVVAQEISTTSKEEEEDSSTNATNSPEFVVVEGADRVKT